MRLKMQINQPALPSQLQQMLNSYYSAKSDGPSSADRCVLICGGINAPQAWPTYRR